MIDSDSDMVEMNRAKITNPNLSDNDQFDEITTNLILNERASGFTGMAPDSASVHFDNGVNTSSGIG